MARVEANVLIGYEMNGGPLPAEHLARTAMG